MDWLQSWKYSKKITLSGSPDIQPGHQILLKVGESEGSSNYDFHLEGHSEKFPIGKNDSGDIRFTGLNAANIFPIWVEKVEGTAPNRTAYVWVKLLEVSDTDFDIYCYYGNSGALNVSNGEDVFELFDDFDGDSVDTDKWDGTFPLTVENSIVYLTPFQLRVSISSKKDFVGDVIFEARVYQKDVRGMGFGQRGNAYEGDIAAFHLDGVSIENGGDQGTGRTVSFPVLHNTWKKVKIVWARSDYTVKVYDNDVLKVVRHTGIPDGNPPMRIFFYIYNKDNAYLEIDYVFVRKYASNPPQFIASSEELQISKLSGIITDMNGNPITGKHVKVLIINIEMEKVIATVVTNEQGGWYIGHLPVAPETEVGISYVWKSTNDFDTSIAGAYFDVTRRIEA